jgi:hypothetical protein
MFAVSPLNYNTPLSKYSFIRKSSYLFSFFHKGQARMSFYTNLTKMEHKLFFTDKTKLYEYKKNDMKIEGAWINFFFRGITMERISSIPFLAIYRKNKVAPGVCHLLGLKSQYEYISYLTLFFKGVEGSQIDMTESVE